MNGRSMTEPTIGDVLAELRTLNLEIRAGFAESRARDAELSVRVTTLVDSVADLRNEYHGHTHPDAT